MRNTQNALLSGIAAIALIGTTSLALAQQSPTGPGNEKPTAGTSSTAKSPQAMKPSAGGAAGEHAQSQGAAAPGISKNERKGSEASAKGNEAAAQQQKQNGSDKQQSRATTAKGDRSVENALHNNKASQERTQMGEDQTRARSGRDEMRSSQREEHRGSVSADQRDKRGGTTATSEQRHTSTVERTERDSRLKGLHADTTLPTSRENVRLTDQQRSKIRETVIEGRNAPRVGRVDFDLRVGSTVPRRHVRIVPVPETLVQIEPEWSGYLYFVYEDEVVIVNPRDMRIVAVLDV